MGAEHGHPLSLLCLSWAADIVQQNKITKEDDLQSDNSISLWYLLLSVELWEPPASSAFSSFVLCFYVNIEMFRPAKPTHVTFVFRHFCCFRTNLSMVYSVEWMNGTVGIIGFILNRESSRKKLWSNRKKSQIISLGFRFCSQIDNEASFLSLLKVRIWCAKYLHQAL